MEKYIIFDIDGTINKTENYVFKAYKECFEKYGINITKNEIIKFIGCTPKQIQDMYFSKFSHVQWKFYLHQLKFVSYFQIP